MGWISSEGTVIVTWQKDPVNLDGLKFELHVRGIRFSSTCQGIQWFITKRGVWNTPLCLACVLCSSIYIKLVSRGPRTSVQTALL